MRILILGGSGFIGTAVTRMLLADGHSVVISTRKASIAANNQAQQSLSWAHWDGQGGESLAPLLDGVDGVINLLGENLAARRWNTEQKSRILQSRLSSCQALCQALSLRLEKGESVPDCLVQASACGYYGLWNDIESAPLCTEESPAGRGFLAETCIAWENATRAVEDMGIRRCLMRTAPVIGAGGGFLQKMLPAFRWGVGGALGSGKQPFSWIHLEDEARAVCHLLEHKTLSGAFNLSSPHPVSMNQLAKTLGRELHRPAFFRVPAFALRLALGEMAQEMLLMGQAVTPARLTAAGFVFAFPHLENALHKELAPASA